MRRGLRHPAGPKAANGDGTLSVTELTRRIKSLLEAGIGPVAVEGEISGMKASPSGHVYFSLKDQNALIDAVIWRSAATAMRNIPKDGEKVVARGRIAVYEPRGRYQLVVTSFQGAGKGDLWRQFEELKEKLAAEGLFDAGRKAALPESPRVLGIVTSPSGAALQDILKIVRRRSPALGVVVSPCLVQGKGAAADIAAAIGRLDRWGGADVMIVGRGGGSLEDLWAFNEEAVARAIAASVTPVVSAVGHETDFTIADFAADARAATPSEAAERIAPDQAMLRGRLAHTAAALARALAGQARECRERLAGLARSPAFRKPLDLFMPRWQRLDDAFMGLDRSMHTMLEHAEHRRKLAEARLEGLSPRGALSRGYAVVTNAAGMALSDAGSVKPGDRVTAILHKGRIEAEVAAVREE